MNSDAAIIIACILDDQVNSFGFIKMDVILSLSLYPYSFTFRFIDQLLHGEDLARP